MDAVVLFSSSSDNGRVTETVQMLERVSLADIARNTGFAVSTVSMALRHAPDISLPTRHKIEEAARILGYYPNPLLAALASKHFGSRKSHGTPLAYIHGPQKTASDETIVREIIGAGQEYGRRMGYRLELFDIGDFKDGVHATRVLFSRGVQGIVLAPLFKLSSLPGMDWSRFSVVGWGSAISDSPGSAAPLLYRSAVDHFGVILRAWDEVWKRKYRKIGFVLFNRSSESMDDRLRWGAIQTCLQGVPPRLRIPPFVHQPALRGGGYDAVKLAKWVRRHGPDAIIGFNDVIRWALQQEGYRTPQDIGFAVLHKEIDSELHPAVKTPDSGMKHVKFESILATLELLDQQIRRHLSGLPPSPRTLLIHSEWVEGETLPYKAA